MRRMRKNNCRPFAANFFLHFDIQSVRAELEQTRMPGIPFYYTLSGHFGGHRRFAASLWRLQCRKFLQPHADPDPHAGKLSDL